MSGFNNGGTLTAAKITAAGGLIAANNLSDVAAVATARSNLGVNLHGCKAFQTATQTPANNTPTLVLFDTEDYDTDAYHSTSSQTSRFTIPAGLAGTYLIVATIGWAASATGIRAIDLLKNGASLNRESVQLSTSSASITEIQTTGVASLAVGDFVEAQANQTSLAGLATLASVTCMSVTRLGV